MSSNDWFWRLNLSFDNLFWKVSRVKQILSLSRRLSWWTLCKVIEIRSFYSTHNPFWICGLPNRKFEIQNIFGCSTAVLKQQMALNFELVASNQLFSVVLACCKWFKISAPGVEMPHMWQLDSNEITNFGELEWWRAVKKCQNLTIKVKFLCQNSSKSFWFFFHWRMQM